MLLVRRSTPNIPIEKLFTKHNVFKTRVVLFYAITAILTLFRNILHNPLGPEAHHHVHILREVPDLIRRIPIRKLTLGEVIHLRFVDGFTTELARLGACAISQVQLEATDIRGTQTFASSEEWPL